ncbi:PepSY domain-containing protein [Citreimonas salinaria]|nr:PepSY domain-containing protein [Citreimonas salinaria]
MVEEVAGEDAGWSSTTSKIEQPPEELPPMPAKAKAAEYPGFISPALATLKPSAPSGEKWLHEIKFDGYRLQAHVREGRSTLFTRSGYDWTDRFGGAIPAALGQLNAQDAILDGELVVEGRAARRTSRCCSRISRRVGSTAWCSSPSTSFILTARICARRRGNIDSTATLLWNTETWKRNNVMLIKTFLSATACSLLVGTAAFAQDDVVVLTADELTAADEAADLMFIEMYGDAVPTYVTATDAYATMQAMGYTGIHDLDVEWGLYEVEAFAPDGNEVEIEYDPVTGAILDIDDNWF